jgi:hypothetical protein
MFSMRSVPRLYSESHREKLHKDYDRKGSVATCVEAGSNTFTVTLRVVGGDGKESLKSETVKYGRQSQGTRTR